MNCKNCNKCVSDMGIKISEEQGKAKMWAVYLKGDSSLEFEINYGLIENRKYLVEFLKKVKEKIEWMQDNMDEVIKLNLTPSTNKK